MASSKNNKNRQQKRKQKKILKGSNIVHEEVKSIVKPSEVTVDAETNITEYQDEHLGRWPKDTRNVPGIKKIPIRPMPVCKIPSNLSCDIEQGLNEVLPFEDPLSSEARVQHAFAYHVMKHIM